MVRSSFGQILRILAKNSASQHFRGLARPTRAFGPRHTRVLGSCIFSLVPRKKSSRIVSATPHDETAARPRAVARPSPARRSLGLTPCVQPLLILRIEQFLWTLGRPPRVETARSAGAGQFCCAKGPLPAGAARRDRGPPAWARSQPPWLRTSPGRTPSLPVLGRSHLPRFAQSLSSPCDSSDLPYPGSPGGMTPSPSPRIFFSSALWVQRSASLPNARPPPNLRACQKKKPPRARGFRAERGHFLPRSKEGGYWGGFAHSSDPSGQSARVARVARRATPRTCLLYTSPSPRDA